MNEYPQSTAGTVVAFIPIKSWLSARFGSSVVRLDLAPAQDCQSSA
jgi:hypothetical protein